MTVVDSSSWIEALRERGDPEVRSRVESLLDAGEAAWCAMVRLELWRGVRSGTERRNLEFLESRITMLEISAAVWEAAVHLVVRARSSGLTAPAADVLIVATAEHYHARLEHCDKHMERLLKLV
jgi:predicted nucleic acid-binding protein